MSHLTETVLMRGVWVVLSIAAAALLYRRYRETEDVIDRHLMYHFLIWGVLYYGPTAILFGQWISVDHELFPGLFVLFYPISIVAYAHLWKAYNDITGVDYHHLFWGYIVGAAFTMGFGFSRLPEFTVRDGAVALAAPSIFNGLVWVALVSGTLVLAAAGIVSAYRRTELRTPLLLLAIASLSLFTSYFIPHLFDGMNGTLAGQITKAVWLASLMAVAYREELF